MDSGCSRSFVGNVINSLQIALPEHDIAFFVASRAHLVENKTL